MTPDEELEIRRRDVVINGNPATGPGLVPLEPSHINDIMAWESCPEVAQQLFPGPAPSTIASRTQAPLRGPQQHLAIVLYPEERLIGYLTLCVVSETSSKKTPPTWGSFTIVIGPEFQRRGYGRRILRRVPALMKSWYGLEVMLIGVFEENIGAIQLYESLGFVETARRWLWTDSTKRRAIMMSNKPELWRREPMGFGRR